jgi:hypothetical protein
VRVVTDERERVAISPPSTHRAQSFFVNNELNVSFSFVVVIMRFSGFLEMWFFSFVYF